MADERILAKIDELEGYLKELERYIPEGIAGYKGDTKRACERLLQISIEAVIDIAVLLVKELRLGLPAEEDDVFQKLQEAGIITALLNKKLREMKGTRNILVHRYGDVNDAIVFSNIRKPGDFRAFIKVVRSFLRKRKPQKSK